MRAFQRRGVKLIVNDGAVAVHTKKQWCFLALCESGKVEERADTTGPAFEDSGIICDKARFQAALRCADNLQQSRRYQEVLVAADQGSLVACSQGHSSRGVPE